MPLLVQQVLEKPLAAAGVESVRSERKGTRLGPLVRDPSGEARLARLGMKRLGADMAIALAEQQPAEGQALNGRPQAGVAQLRLEVDGPDVRMGFARPAGDVGNHGDRLVTHVNPLASMLAL